ncbi:MAG TPA: STAS/SEC14 domain-containing protein [Hanamia sp.]|nr:STAS/SEC14 domain-containing protein [Hanamia sp.]
MKKYFFLLLRAAVKKNKDLKVLCWLGENFKGFKLGALKEDMVIGIKYFKDWKKIAFVSDKEWMNHTVKAFGFLMPAKVRTFENKGMNAAIKWLSE